MEEVFPGHPASGGGAGRKRKMLASWAWVRSHKAMRSLPVSAVIVSAFPEPHLKAVRGPGSPGGALCEEESDSSDVREGRRE